MPVEVSVLSSPFAEHINGTYTCTEERLNDKTVYSKLGDASKCLFFASDQKWWVSARTADVKAGKPTGFAHTEPGLPHPTRAKKWRMWGGKSWNQQAIKASVIVSLNIFYALAT